MKQFLIWHPYVYEYADIQLQSCQCRKGAWSTPCFIHYASLICLWTMEAAEENRPPVSMSFVSNRTERNMNDQDATNRVEILANQKCIRSSCFFRKDIISNLLQRLEERCNRNMIYIAILQGTVRCRAHSSILGILTCLYGGKNLQLKDNIVEKYRNGLI